MDLGLLDDPPPDIPIMCFFHHASTFSVFTSFQTLSSHLNLGLPFFQEPSGREKVTFLQGQFSYILTKCPSHLILATFIILTISRSLYKLYSSSLYLILRTPFSHVGPQILLNTPYTTYKCLHIFRKYITQQMDLRPDDVALVSKHDAK
jgi:hypothetical protein